LGEKSGCPRKERLSSKKNSQAASAVSFTGDERKKERNPKHPQGNRSKPRAIQDPKRKNKRRPAKKRGVAEGGITTELINGRTNKAKTPMGLNLRIQQNSVIRKYPSWP